MSLILVAVISLGAIGLISAVILYVASKKFAVYEDPRIAQVAEVLPQANAWMWFPGMFRFCSCLCKSWFSGGKMCPVAVSLQWRRSQVFWDWKQLLQNRRLR